MIYVIFAGRFVLVKNKVCAKFQKNSSCGFGVIEVAIFPPLAAAARRAGG